MSACADGDGAFDLSRRRHLVAVDRRGVEHVVLLGGGTNLRLDVVAGTLLAGPVALRIHLGCNDTIAPRLSALERLLQLLGIRDPGRRAPRADPRLARLVEALRVVDALAEGASLSRIAAGLRGDDGATNDWPGDGDHVKSLVRRRVALARRLATGGPAGVMPGSV